jgi:uncharacterized protein Yka (UPF0111/DUF47 family)
MRLSIVRVVQELAGASNREFVILLTGQLDATLAGAHLAGDVVAGVVAPDQAQERMRQIEHEGDDFRVRLTTALFSSLVTPIDREDLYRVSRSIDDVLDNLRDFLREWALFQVKAGSALGPLLQAVAAAVTSLREAVAAIDNAPDRVRELAMTSKRANVQVRRQYEIQLAELLRGDVTMRVLKTRELLRRLDVVGLRLGEAADVLSDAAIKRNA